MGGGNGQKSKMAREKNMEKQNAAAKGSQLESNKKAMTIQELLQIVNVDDKNLFDYVGLPENCVFY